MAIEKIQRQHLFGAGLSGFLLTAAFPKFDLFLLAWVSLVPLLVSIRRLTVWDSFRVGLVAGVVHYLTLMYWIGDTMRTYGGLPWYLSALVLLLFATYLAAYVGIFSALARKLCHSPVGTMMIVPALWVSLEFIRATVLTGFPWALLGYSQYKALRIIQISDIFGTYGVSFLIAMGNGCLFIVWRYFSKTDQQRNRISGRQILTVVLSYALVFGGSFIYGNYRISAVKQQMENASSTRVSVVQGNIRQDLKWNPAFIESTVDKYLSLSKRAGEMAPHLVVWPETAAVFYFGNEQPYTDRVIELVKSLGIDFLVGSPSFEKHKKGVVYRNSAYLINAEGSVAGRYDKAHLVPFGEYVPLKKWLPFIGKMVTAVGDFEPGKKGQTLPWKDRQLGVQICYEMVFPKFSRQIVNNGADVLLNLTNDAWYGRSSAPFQLFSMAVFRAVENRRSVVRSANTGISGIIDPTGVTQASTPLFEDSVLTRSIPILKIRTTYGKWGDWLPAICCIWMCGLLIKTRFDLITQRRR